MWIRSIKTIVLAGYTEIPGKKKNGKYPKYIWAYFYTEKIELA